MLDFTLYQPQMALLAGALGSEIDFGAFTDKLLQSFESHLDARLVKLQERLRLEGRERFVGLLNTLESDVEARSGEGALSDLVNAIRRARTALQQTLRKHEEITEALRGANRPVRLSPT